MTSTVTECVCMWPYLYCGLRPRYRHIYMVSLYCHIYIELLAYTSSTEPPAQSTLSLNALSAAPAPGEMQALTQRQRRGAQRKRKRRRKRRRQTARWKRTRRQKGGIGGRGCCFAPCMRHPSSPLSSASSHPSRCSLLICIFISIYVHILYVCVFTGIPCEGPSSCPSHC